MKAIYYLTSCFVLLLSRQSVAQEHLRYFTGNQTVLENWNKAYIHVEFDESTLLFTPPVLDSNNNQSQGQLTPLKPPPELAMPQAPSQTELAKDEPQGHTTPFQLSPSTKLEEVTPLHENLHQPSQILPPIRIPQELDKIENLKLPPVVLPPAAPVSTPNNAKVHPRPAKKQKPKEFSRPTQNEETIINNDTWEVLKEVPLHQKVHTRDPYERKTEVSPKITKKVYGEGNKHLPKPIHSSEYSQLLFAAVANDDIQSIKALLAKGAQINVQDQRDGYTPLLHGIKLKKNAAVRYLLMRGADSNKAARDGKNALHIAAICGNIQIFRALLTSQCDIVATDLSGKRPLQYLSDAKQLQNYLIDVAGYYPEPNKALWDFILLGSAAGSKFALDHGADPNFQEDDTILITAIRRNNSTLVSLLLMNGASLTKSNRAGVTPIQVATSLGYENIIKILQTVRFKRELDEIAKEDEDKYKPTLRFEK